MGTVAKSILHRITALLLPACLLAGCSGIKPYPDTFKKNLHVHTETDSGSLLSSVRAAVDIYQVGPHCQTEYQGTVDLDGSSLAIGLPVGQPSYLVFGFASSSWLANSSSTISYDTLLTPRDGYDYDIDVSYVDDIYHVAILERNKRNRIRRDIGQQALNDCISH